jgi:sigma-B regulation protein RsbU (phosphoserine phosphatase)
MAEAVAEVNKQLYSRSSPEIFSTLVLNHYDSESRRLAYCNAGHHPPLLFSNGDVRDLTTGGTVVGLFENWDYEGAEVQLKPGDLLIFFTDGVVEAESDEGEQFGTERLVELIKSNTFLTAHDIQALILEQVFEWSGSQDQADDITVVSFKVLI